MNELIKLQIGAGRHRFDGWKNFDIRPEDEPDFIGDATTLVGVPLMSCSHIYASHVLEHFPHADTIEVLRTWKSRLASGGLMWLSVPDLDKICELHLKYKDIRQPPSFPWNALIYGGQNYEYNFHYAGFNFKYLKYCMEKAGLTNVRQLNSIPIAGVTDYSTCRYEGELISVNVEGIRS